MMKANDSFFMEYIDFLDVMKQKLFVCRSVGPSVAVCLICIEMGGGPRERLLHVSREMGKLF